MAEPQTNYENTDFNGHVNIGDCKLHVQLAGRPRKHGDPLIICMHGTAGHLEQFAAVVRTLQPNHRLLAYTRSGLGHSDPKPTQPDNATPLPPTLDSIANELHALLTALSLPPPYILIGHSWGGMISLHATSTFSPTPIPGIQGLILLDAGMPTLSPAYQPLYSSFSTDPGTPWAHPSVAALLSGLDTFNLQDPRNRLQLTDTEYAALLTARSTPSHQSTTPLDFRGLLASYTPFSHTSYHTPTALPLIPICLVHAHAHESFRTMYKAGLARGNGTASERADFETLLKTWKEDVLQNQRQFLRYVKDERLGRAVLTKEGTSHGVHLQDVQSVVDGVEWVLEHRVN